MLYVPSVMPNSAKSMFVEFDVNVVPFTVISKCDVCCPVLVHDRIIVLLTDRADGCANCPVGKESVAGLLSRVNMSLLRATTETVCVPVIVNEPRSML